MNLLHILPTMNPEAGGPFESVRQFAAHAHELGHTVEILTLDDRNEPFIANFSHIVHALGPSRSNYRYNNRLVPWLKSHAHNYDAVIVNGIWQYHSFGTWKAIRRLGIPYYVFTHGMLDPWFKRTYPLKHIKKWLYWPWAEYRVLRDARAVLFTCEEERRLASQSFWLYRARERVVSFGTSVPPANANGRLRDGFLSAYPELRGKRILLFLGRLHEKKGCDLLVHAFARTMLAEEDVHLVMAGPDHAGWLNKLKGIADSLGMANRISWPGMLRGDMKWGAFYTAEVFVLPSHQENFGIAVAEALGCGMPVLISDKVNIWREIEMDGCGLVSPDSLQGTERSLRSWLSLDIDQRKTMSVNATRTFRKRFTAAAMVTSVLEVLVDTA